LRERKGSCCCIAFHRRRNSSSSSSSAFRDRSPPPSFSSFSGSESTTETHMCIPQPRRAGWGWREEAGAAAAAAAAAAATRMGDVIFLLLLKVWLRENVGLVAFSSCSTEKKKKKSTFRTSDRENLSPRRALPSPRSPGHDHAFSLCAEHLASMPEPRVQLDWRFEP